GRTNRSWVASASVIPFPTADALRDGSARVTHNNGWDRLQLAAPRRDAAPKPLPDRVGEPSPIKKVVYIIKENRTYVQALGGDALSYLPSGFLWENAQEHGRTVRVYGEYATEESSSAATHSDVPTLQRVLDREFPPFDLTVSDQDKARMFLADLAAWEQPGGD